MPGYCFPLVHWVTIEFEASDKSKSHKAILRIMLRAIKEKRAILTGPVHERPPWRPYSYTMMVIVNDVYNMENEAYDKAEKLVKDMIPRVVTHGLPFNHQNIFGM
jgi:hypothetical protein